ncbi:uncharacterized protein VTP21DRAFT_4233 [Calcarisporiella thermophila]|uniref:uncharacterized protein n=1 Tax=Calcarisporiella thermophila TaxID=911321 RepID=UPI003742B7FB
MATSYKQHISWRRPSQSNDDDQSIAEWVVARKLSYTSHSSDDEWHVLSPRPSVFPYSPTTLNSSSSCVQSLSDTEADWDHIMTQSIMPSHDGTGFFGNGEDNEFSLEMLQQEMISGGEGKRNGLILNLRKIAALWRGICNEVIDVHNIDLSDIEYTTDILQKENSLHNNSALDSWRLHDLDHSGPSGIPVHILRTIMRALGDIGEFLIEQDTIVAEVFASMQREVDLDGWRRNSTELVT